MLGELIYEHTGKITGQRVLDIDEAGLAKIEASLSANGNISPTTNVTITEETEPEVVTPDQIVTFNDLKKLQT